MRPSQVRHSKTVVALVYSGVETMDLVGPVEILSGANRLMALQERKSAPMYSIVLAGPGRKKITTASGLSFLPHRSRDSVASPIDTLIVPGAFDVESLLADKALIRWIQRKARRARRIVSVCSGAFLLAEAGLLNGRRATTHWASCRLLAERYPRVQVEPDPIFVRDGFIYTSAGVTAGMDLALALVEEDVGRKIALELARWFVMYLRRPGGQSQFSVRLAAQISESEALQEILDWITENPAKDLSVNALARKAGMSPRHFARIFRKQARITPASYVSQTRLERARQRLEETSDPQKAIALECGFGTVESLRRSFQRSLKVSPGDYRKRFQTGPAPWSIPPPV